MQLLSWSSIPKEKLRFSRIAKRSSVGNMDEHQPGSLNSEITRRAGAGVSYYSFAPAFCPNNEKEESCTIS